MIPSTYRDLFDLLIERSSEGAVGWRGTTTTGRYAVELGEVTYEIEDAYDEDSGPMLVFRVRGDRGRMIDSFTLDSRDGDDWGLISSLYEYARRAVAQVDSALEILRRATPAAPAGGSQSGIAEESDDIPF